DLGQGQQHVPVGDVGHLGGVGEAETSLGLQDDAVEDIQLRDLEDVLDRADLLATRGLDRDASGESLVGDPPGVRHDPRMRAFWAVRSLLGNPMTMYSTGRMLIWS